MLESNPRSQSDSLDSRCDAKSMIIHQPSRTFDIETQWPYNNSKFSSEAFLPDKMVFLKLALVDPDFALPSSPAATTLPSFYRVESHFESGQTINAIFLEAIFHAMSRQRPAGQ